MVFCLGLADLSGVAGAPVVVGRVVVVSDVHHRVRRNREVAVFKEGGLSLPGQDPDVAGDVHRPAPIAVAQGTGDNLIDGDGLAPDLDGYRRGGGLRRGGRRRGGQALGRSRGRRAERLGRLAAGQGQRREGEEHGAARVHGSSLSCSANGIWMVREGLGAPGASMRFTTPRTPAMAAAIVSARSRRPADGASPPKCTTALRTPTRRSSAAASRLDASASRTNARKVSSGIVIGDTTGLPITGSAGLGRAYRPAELLGTTFVLLWIAAPGQSLRIEQDDLVALDLQQVLLFQRVQSPAEDVAHGAQASRHLVECGPWAAGHDQAPLPALRVLEERAGQPGLHATQGEILDQTA